MLLTDIIICCFLCRVKEGKFLLGGVEYQLSRNDAGTDHRHHVHGGEVSFDRLNWNTEVVNQGVVFSVLSSDGSEVRTSLC
jgi:galactose mutarotase-like enzyme